jgi:hypothetical protein
VAQFWDSQRPHLGQSPACLSLLRLVQTCSGFLRLPRPAQVCIATRLCLLSQSLLSFIPCMLSFKSGNTLEWSWFSPKSILLLVWTMWLSTCPNLIYSIDTAMLTQQNSLAQLRHNCTHPCTASALSSLRFNLRLIILAQAQIQAAHRLPRSRSQPRFS